MGERWVCSCGDNFVYREGFNRAGYPSLEWWPAPAIPQPRKATPRAALRPAQGLSDLVRRQSAHVRPRTNARNRSAGGASGLSVRHVRPIVRVADGDDSASPTDPD